MEKKIENSAYTINEEVKFGTIKIANDVIAEVASMAATEVDGVSAMYENVGNNLLTKVGVKNSKKGVRVAIEGNDISLDLAIVVDAGYNIPSVSAKVQEKVKNAVENMTGLNATSINIRVAGVTQA